MGMWIGLRVILLAAAVGAVLLFRSLARWRLPEPTSPEAKQAQARLWSTRTMDQR
ncbi:MAG: hypothetical protein ABI828_01230 [Actinomycetota bacterium]